MLVLDEATSALDNESERRVIGNLREAFAGCTVLMIAHRLSTVRHADLIVVLDHGNIVEQENHEALMERKGLYYFLSTQQLSL
jgi:ABC-type multidrug transport system fused ATPase/permease subunit